ncbi:molybdenum cofactor biosynthesis protein MoaE [Brevibacterium sp. 5221]|uniref:Molybdenum cofactor biosynthesis protein MoaE n=1 Tax=Brevibacterium rongguiense TaxID=2695267 RepID=A0A6N9H6X9_9MICO|nr:molybdenum cofactor biosynthesis protein MoaE [Brevibacterium rongguiense]MYM19719.1 molybdenum cofactor biosynthesis protein MoaE [Brevibacterium rongguiense]
MDSESHAAHAGSEHAATGHRAAVIIASNSAAAGRSADTTGPRLVAWLRGLGLRCGEPQVVADGAPVGAALAALLAEPEAGRPRVIVTSGGTGVTSADLTPEQTAPLLDRTLPGIAHALWEAGTRNTATAVLSRGLAGVAGRTFIVNLPGSEGGVRDGMAVLEPLLPHLLAQLDDIRDHAPRAQQHARAQAQKHAGVGPHAGAGPHTGGKGHGAHSTAPADGSSAPRAWAAVPATEDSAVVEAAVGPEPLDADAVAAAVVTPAMGAVAQFRGLIRHHDAGREDVVGLDYTAHPDAQAVMARVVAEVAERHPGVRVYCRHRIGELAVGEDAIVVAVAAAHRGAAFACCAQVVDEVKARVPIWKQQHYAAGGHDWVGLQ